MISKCIRRRRRAAAGDTRHTATSLRAKRMTKRLVTNCALQRKLCIYVFIYLPLPLPPPHFYNMYRLGYYLWWWGGLHFSITRQNEIHCYWVTHGRFRLTKGTASRSVQPMTPRECMYSYHTYSSTTTLRYFKHSAFTST